MTRKVYLLLFAVLLLSTVSYGQHVHTKACATTEMNDAYKKDFPKIAESEEQLRAFFDKGVSQMNIGRSRGKGTADDPFNNETLHIPVVVHIVHDYSDGPNAQDYVSDNRIYRMMDSINAVYSSLAGDTISVIAPFKKYIGKPRMQFHLATKDPLGRPTTGITRHHSYLTDGGDDQAKFDQWDPASYLNIWIIRRIGRSQGNGTVLAYAVFPTSAAQFPYTDGIISAAPYIHDDGKTIPHEIGHILSLFHTWGNVPGDAGDCTGDDEVDDTPPTDGHTTAQCPLYDTTCTNVTASLGRILLDKNQTPKVVTDNNVGFEFHPHTNLVIENVTIYPNKIGEEFTIGYLRRANMNAPYSLQQEYKTKTTVIGATSLGGTTAVSTENSNFLKSAIEFDTRKHSWLDSFKIYPNVSGAAFRVLLINGVGDTVKDYTGTTTTNSGAQNVPFSHFFKDGNGYKLQIVTNPGLKCDINVTAPTYKRSEAGFVTMRNEVDASSSDRYNFFYAMSFRYDGLTTTDSSAQVVDLGFSILPSDTTNDKIEVTKNPGLWNDSVPAVAYINSTACVIDIKNERTDKRYDLLYDINIRYGYIKNCVDYPDTANTQNIMDYVACPIMFTKGQVARMRGLFESNVANRGGWINDTTHVRTGILDAFGGTYGKRTDLRPIPDLSVERSSGLSPERNYFMCADGTRQFIFRDRSWRDTVTAAEYSFPNGASQANVTRSQVNLNSNITNTFTQSGWVDVTVKVTGNNSGDSTRVIEKLVYAADPNAVDPSQGFYMEFNANDGGSYDLNKWPIFNYFKNDYKWEVIDNNGFYDNSCIVYRGYDNRVGTQRYNGTPLGDFDDFFTPAFDLSSMAGKDCSLNFMSSGVYRVTDPNLMKDNLNISYSTDCGATWQSLKDFTKRDLANKGTLDIPYAPLWTGDWKLQSVEVPAQARQSKVYFRFRFTPGADDINANAGRTIPGTGNNFYIDRINVSQFKAGVNTLLTDDKNIAIAPNPTNGGAQLAIKSTERSVAKVIVTDITGKLVYNVDVQLKGNITNVEIPASAIAVKGVYMVQVQAGSERFTEKLVSY